MYFLPSCFFFAIATFAWHPTETWFSQESRLWESPYQTYTLYFGIIMKSLQTLPYLIPYLLIGIHALFGQECIKRDWYSPIRKVQNFIGNFTGKSKRDRRFCNKTFCDNGKYLVDIHREGVRRWNAPLIHVERSGILM